MAKYAEKTTVAADRSRAEIEKTLTRYGADQFIYGWDADHDAIGFRMNGRQVKFSLPKPDINSDDIRLTESGKERTQTQINAAYEQAERQRWRALALVIKAKLEAVEAGITVFDNEFMAHIALPDGQTVGDFMRPQIELAYEKGTMPALLPAPGGDK